ncbi:MAG TPA: CoA transferase [Casimicrobiaceae bacterium]|nr:CoA transferase [Casimicrobiaceae bacterium]
MTSPAAPLAGLTILDCTNVLAGPFACYQLACLGARVIKIESPTGDLARRLGSDPAYAREAMGISFLAANAGKESIALDFKHPRGREVFEKLVVRADALVENFRPGVMERLGLGPARLRELKPPLVVCAISGFGQTGPLAQRPAYDQIVQGLSGVMSVTGDERSAPLRVGYPVCDSIGGLTAAFAVCAALLRAKATGEGAFVDVSMLDATLATMGWVVSNYLNGGVEPRAIGNDNFTAAPSGTFRTGNGLLNIAANEQRQFEALADLLGLADLKRDARFADREARKRHRAELTGILESTLASRSAAEWEAMLIEVGVPAGQVMSVPQILAHPHAAEGELVATFADVPGTPRDVRVLRPGFRVDGERPAPSRRPPTPSEHRDALLEELGYAAAERAALVAAGAVH